MNIDYDRLRELEDTATPGPWKIEIEETSTCGDLIQGLAAWVEADNERVFGCGMEIEEDEELTNLALAALAPDMARELLRLRDGVTELANEFGAKAEVAPNIPRKVAFIEANHALTVLLNGGTE